MEKLTENIIPGAAFDSSERDPPPKCHPGTRLAIIERALRFFANQKCNEKLLWLVGPAGVGKSAIMQTFAETPSTPSFTLGASLFFSVNGRDNGTKTITTLAYQLAVKSELYRGFIQSELDKDPTLLVKALAPQFNKFIVEPFVARGILPEGHERFLILIDGLDECKDQRTQCAILDLIVSFCVKFPAAPLVWVVASRPEPHITRFLSQLDAVRSHTKEEIEVDSNQSCEDVERYLRKELEKIRIKYPALDHCSRWPGEHDFLKLATAAGGLFAYGSAVVSYIDDPVYANPELQLGEVLEVIEEVQSEAGEGKRHPMADLDALYSRIVSKIPRDTLNDAKKLLLQILCPPSLDASEDSLQTYCNWLGMTPAAAHSALHHLHSVLDIPSMSDASLRKLEFRHKSFCDYISDSKRSGMFLNLDDEADELYGQCALRILNGTSKARIIGLDPYAGISLSWPPPAESNKYEKGNLYYSVFWFVVGDLLEKSARMDARFDSGVLSALKLIDIQFGHELKPESNLLLWISPLIFGKYIRAKLKEMNAFKEVSIGTLDMGKIAHWMGTTIFYHSKQQNLGPTFPKCEFGYSHKQGRDQRHPDGGYYWHFSYLSTWSTCDCVNRALEKLEDRKTQSPDDILIAFTDITGDYGWIYHTFPDPENTSSTLEYIVPYQFKP